MKEWPKEGNDNSMCIVGVYDIEQIVLFPSESIFTMCENRIELQGLSFYQAWLLDVTS